MPLFNPLRISTKQQGFTLIEMLLVIIIMSVIMMMIASYTQQKTQNLLIEHETANMQAILNAALAYYVANGHWPDQLDKLKPNFLPTVPTSLFGTYAIKNNIGLFSINTKIDKQAPEAYTLSTIIAGNLPLGYSSDKPFDAGTCSPTASNTCYAIGSVNIPGYNLNNATAVNFAGLYHSGACVPVPACPVDKDGHTMTPQIFVAPVQVTGLHQDPTSTSSIYPISSFQAFATKPAAWDKVALCRDANHSEGCRSNSNPETPLFSAGAHSGEQYWRVCLALATEQGVVTTTSLEWGKAVGTILAFTRCAIQDEPAGSSFNVWNY